MQKKFLPKLLVASLLVGGVNFLPAVVNFDAENLQIVSVAYAKVENVTASGKAIFNFGEDDEKIVNTVKNVAKMRAVQAAKEKAGVYVKSFSKTVDGVLTDDDISAYTSNNIEILDVQYKKVPVQAHDVKGNDTGEIAFMYEAIVKAKIDTAGLTAYIQRDFEEKQKIVQNNQSSQENIAKISNDFDNLRNSTKDVEQIKSDVNKIDREILAQQKIDEGDKIFNTSFNGQFTWEEEERRYNNAILKYMEAIEIDPGCFDAYHRISFIYASEMANVEISRAIGESEINGRKENFSKVFKCFDLAIYFSNQAVKNNPNSGEAYFIRSITYHNVAMMMRSFIDEDSKKVYEFFGKSKADRATAEKLGYKLTTISSIFKDR